MENENILAKKMNAIIIDADKVAKQSSRKGETYYNEIVKIFGEEIIENDEINRKRLAKIIYNNKEQRNKLNKLTNQYVVEQIKEQMKKIQNKNLNEMCNITVSLIADEKTKIERMIARDRIDENLAKKRLEIQQPNKYYIEKSNYVIVNNKSDLEDEAEEFIKTVEMLNEKIVITKNEDIKYMQIKELLKHEKIKHCFTLRPMNFGDNLTYQQNKEIIQNNYTYRQSLTK